MIDPSLSGHYASVGYPYAAPSNPTVHGPHGGSLLDATEPPSPAPAGPRDAFRAFVLDHFDFVWRVLRRLGVPPADVDDAVQQVFLIAADRLVTIAKGSERAFLYGTALRTASTHRRTASRQKKRLDLLLSGADDRVSLPDEELERREAIALLDETLGALPDEYRRVFVLSDLENLSAREIALFENIPPGTVASRLRRARELFSARVRELRGELEEEA